MNAQTKRLELLAPHGVIEVLQDEPYGNASDIKGLALFAHPHPLHQGTMEHKVVQTLARAATVSGYRAIRFNFRGVGHSAGVYGAGSLEKGDLLWMLQWMRQEHMDLPIVLGGFSFGSFVTALALSELPADSSLTALLLIGMAASRFAVPEIAESLRDKTLTIHGEQDDVVSLQYVLDWARPQSLPITVIPGAGHFFHGQLTLLRDLCVRHIQQLSSKQ